MPGIFQNENKVHGLQPNAAYQVGISDLDTLGNAPESGVNAGWLIDPDVSWLEYECWIECRLDSGVVTHRQLPQSVQSYDTLGQITVDDPLMAVNKNGINLKSKGKFTGLVQRMANSVYRFNLKGRALRMGYQIPIPSLKSVAGVPAIPDDEDPQKAFCMLWGNYSGVPVYLAQWSLWYTVSVPPTKPQDPPADLADHIAATDQLPQGIQVPVTVPDSQAVRAAPSNLQLQNPIQVP
jgi:hypothetical protein